MLWYSLGRAIVAIGLRGRSRCKFPCGGEYNLVGRGVSMLMLWILWKIILQVLWGLCVAWGACLIVDVDDGCEGWFSTWSPNVREYSFYHGKLSILTVPLPPWSFLLQVVPRLLGLSFLLGTLPVYLPLL